MAFEANPWCVHIGVRLFETALPASLARSMVHRLAFSQFMDK